ncbi:MAG: type III pantothenate kinase [Dehalococcoidales bacterium]|nr:type III pantothenate kinase [Dehalococcoidales bacterium]
MRRTTDILLAVDIGNTRTAIGLFDGARLKTVFHVGTSINRYVDEYAMELLSRLRHEGIPASAITASVICCTVPPLANQWRAVCQQYFHIDPLLVKAGIRTGLRIAADNPVEVGGDRIANAAAAFHMYGSPVIVVDFGTATVFDIISHGACYTGCVIAPGIESAAGALSDRAAQLPHVGLAYSSSVIAKNTVDALRSGITAGHICLVEGILTRVQRELKQNAVVVATGPYCEPLAHRTALIKIVQPVLTLIGLRVLYELNQARHHCGVL